MAPALAVGSFGLCSPNLASKGLTQPVLVTSAEVNGTSRTPSIGDAQLPSSPPTPFDRLVTDLSAILGPTSGLTTEGIDLEGLNKLMKEYVSEEEDWGRFAFVDTSRGYTRNLVDEGNGKSNLLILVWSPGKGSLIHDHADAHCLMRILKGSLLETRYNPPSGSSPCPTVIRETTYTEGELAYIADDLGVHKISNPSSSEIAVSLHLYTPPNAAREGCNVFCPRTGKRSHVLQNNFYSVRGVKVKE